MAYEAKRWLQSLILVMVLGLFLAACGSSDEDADGDIDGDTNEPTGGQLFLGGNENGYMLPHLFTHDGELAVLYRNALGIFLQKPYTGDTITVDMLGQTNPNYGVTNYTLNENYLVWNESGLTYRYQWNRSTLSAQTGLLAPGMCITKNLRGDDVLVGAASSGQMYTIALSNFNDAQERVPKSLTDPADNTENIRVHSFACSGETALVGSEDGRLFSLNLNDPTPTLVTLPNVSGESFDLLQYSPPYVVWVDLANDIKVYSLEAQLEPLVLDVDPNNRVPEYRLRDLRIFDNIVLWSDTSSGSSDIWGADLTLTQGGVDYIQITNEIHDQSYPFIYENKIYWQDNRDDLDEIFYGSLPAF